MVSSSVSTGWMGSRLSACLFQFATLLQSREFSIMRHRSCFLFLNLAFITICLFVPTDQGVARAQTTPPNITTRLLLAAPTVQRGRMVRASLVIEIPAGYHVNAHDPISRFALPTRIAVEAPDGLRVNSIVYPKAIVRRLSFSEDSLGVYENRAVIKIRLTVSPNQPKGNIEIKVRLTYQSCSDEVCFPPMTVRVTASFNVL